MKGRIILLNLLWVAILVCITASPVYAGNGHNMPEGHKMDHGMMPNGHEDKMISSYLKIQESLANDTLDGVASEAKMIINNAGLLKKHNDNSQLIGEIEKQAAHLSHGKISDIRNQFATLSLTFIDYLKKSESEKKLFTFFCPMKKKYWIQDNDKVANPFLGKEMQGCGNIVAENENLPISKMMMGDHKHN